MEFDCSNIKIKKDRYRKTRGGYSELLQIQCSHCALPTFIYQKDGPGDLQRCYFDRILLPKDLNAQLKSSDIKSFPSIKCVECNKLIGIATIYKKENRPAFIMCTGAFRKSIISK